MSERVIVQVPFAGMYNSVFSSELDSVEEREAEYYTEDRQVEECVPVELRLEQADVADILWRCADYSKAHADIAKAYVGVFADAFEHNVFPGLSLEFEGMQSPREYNFTTDRVYAWADLGAIRDLFASINRKAMDEVARERHTSRDGFHSFYSPEWETWGDVSEWDHNQFETLIRAAIRATGEEAGEWDMQLYENLYEDIYNAWQDCVDWAKFDELCEEARDEKEAELREDDPDYVHAPVRCSFTAEMFPETVRR